MPTDLLLTIAAPGTKTATFNSAALTLPKGSTSRNAYLEVPYTAASNATGANAFTFDVDVSYDGGSTWTELAGTAPLNLSTTAQAGAIYLPVPLTRQDLVNANAANSPQIRVTGTLSGAGTVPTITVGQISYMPVRD